jgi:Fic family protein
MSNLELAVELKAQLDALRPLNPEQEKRIWQKFRFDWNYHSNNIEGNSLTFGETKSLLLHNITAQGKPLKDHIEITGHNEAIDALVELTRGDAPLTESFVRQLHALILRERYQVDAITAEGTPTRRWIEVGQYKTGQNHVQTVTGEIFRFTEPMDVPAKMHTLLQTINELQAPSSAEVVLIAAKAHYDFVLIHPFDDGNGRMARLLMNLILIKYGFPPAIIKTEDKANYFSALRQADGGQLDVFVEYIAECVCASMQIMLAGARGESIEEPNEQDRQVKMLARLLEERTPRLTTTRSRDVLIAFFDLSFAPLSRKLHQLLVKFAPMYLENQVRVLVNGSAAGWVDIEADLTNGRNSLGDTTTQCQIGGTLSYLRFRGLDQFGYHWNLTANFSTATYRITSSFPMSERPRTYDEQITADEMDEIASSFFSHHIAAIEKVSGVSARDLLV